MQKHSIPRVFFTKIVFVYLVCNVFAYHRYIFANKIMGYDDDRLQKRD